VDSPDLIGRAVLVVLETDGVRNVVSTLTVRPPEEDSETMADPSDITA
jgi:hypothetical protein